MGRKPSQELPWEEIRVLFALGMPIANIAKKFDMNAAKIYRRAKKHKWAEKEQSVKAELANTSLENWQLSKGKQPQPIVEVINDFYKEKSDNHKKAIIDITEQQIKAIKDNPPPIESIDDLEKVDKIARRNLGLESEESGKTNNYILNLAVLAKKAGEY